MDKLLLQVFELFHVLFDTHIRTKTTDRLFHEDSAQFYEAAFEAYHKIYERLIDLWMMPSLNCEEARTQNLAKMVELLDKITAAVDKNNSIGLDNLLRGLVDSLEDKVGNAKAFTYEEKVEDKEEGEDKTKTDTKTSPFSKI